MSRYLWIHEIQSIYDLGVDAAGRQLVQFNILTRKEPSETFEEELIKILVTAGVGTANVNIFGSTQASIPDGDGPFTNVIATGGPRGIRIHNQVRPAYEQPTALIVSRAATYTAARARARAAYDALVAVVNQTITP